MAKLLRRLEMTDEEQYEKQESHDAIGATLNYFILLLLSSVYIYSRSHV
ncbi:MAG: hypothetical protein NW224_15970 [Leptolyngbyaceae cyanobacterium bins.302]|nr:hypothetical protein [Leptolyngbyaceae cyanobacterium bins.302]